MTRKSGIFQKLWRINFSTHTFWNICDGKNFSVTDISKSMREKLILHRFWKIPLFPVILSWIIYDNELKTVKYISPTKSIRRENLRHNISLTSVLGSGKSITYLLPSSMWLRRKPLLSDMLVNGLHTFWCLWVGWGWYVAQSP